MMRRATPLLATAIPRHVWDPTRHNPNWADTYSTEVADRRHWPAKKWSIGLEPKTPSEWQNFSKRNLAYAYNAALRSCSSFPEMIPLYQEMKLRGVKVDLDTMNALLTRAARFEKIVVSDVFCLFDELIELGARPDMATAETLHTLWEHSITADKDWREVRRGHLIRMYNALAEEDILKYSDKDAPHLLAAQIKRYRENLKSLGASLSPAVYRKYFAGIENHEILIREINNFFWEFVGPDHEAKDDANLRIRIPILSSVLKRPSAQTATPENTKLTDFEDSDVCSVLQTALERVVDHPMGVRTPNQARAVVLAILNLSVSCGTLITSDYLAQMMDIVKYSANDDARDKDAQRVLILAIRGTGVKRDEASRLLWNAVATPCDARVVGRYIAARDPWSATRFCPQGTSFSTFAAGDTVTVQSSAEANAVDPTSQTSLVPTQDGGSTAKSHVLRTGTQVEQRWHDLQGLINSTKALEGHQPAAIRVEVFTGLASFLRHMFTGARLNEHTKDSSISFSAGMNAEVCEKIFALVQETKRDMDVFCEENKVQPELEAWESLLVVLRGLLDFISMQRKSKASGSIAGSEAANDFFNRVSTLRSQMLEESLSRFDGRFKLLWLQEM